MTSSAITKSIMVESALTRAECDEYSAIRPDVVGETEVEMPSCR